LGDRKGNDQRLVIVDNEIGWEKPHVVPNDQRFKRRV
jgi:hypothetical protein